MSSCLCMERFTIVWPKAGWVGSCLDLSSHLFPSEEVKTSITIDGSIQSTFSFYHAPPYVKLTIGHTVHPLSCHFARTLPSSQTQLTLFQISRHFVCYVVCSRHCLRHRGGVQDVGAGDYTWVSRHKLPVQIAEWNTHSLTQTDIQTDRQTQRRISLGVHALIVKPGCLELAAIRAGSMETRRC